LLLAGLAGCSGKDRVPRGVLPRDKMAELIWDLAQADQYATLYLAKDSAKLDLKSETLRLYEEVFRIHQVTREEFTKSYHYYLDHPELNQILFDSVTARGARARTDMYDRPFYHRPAPPAVRPTVPPVLPGKGAAPGLPLKPPGGRIPKGPAGAAPIVPGSKLPAIRVLPGAAHGPTPEEMRRAHDAAVRRSQDSTARALRLRFDTSRKRN
ncbi:MAG TPA: DUF4296 domain-containing protein, partial [Puia sp.]|nr:DUF4296 domain-containing protein [Puia sp.]